MSSSVASRGTRLSILEAVQSPGLHWEDGGWVPSRVGSTRGQILFPQPPGPRSCVAIPGADNVTIPRHVATRRCKTFMAMPRGAVVGLGLGGWALPTLLRSPLGRRARRRAGAGPVGPSPSQRAATRFTILVEALGARRFRRATVRGVDPYGITGTLLAEGARRLLCSEGLVPDAAGVLAPAQAFRPEPFFAALASADLSLDLEEGDQAAPEPS